MTEKKITYKKAIQELEEILDKFENEDLDVDELSSKVKRAAQLIKLCKKKLFDTEAEIEDIMKELDSE